jgi:NADPH:quinone reductase-like Zn-dependent oxidoreductase
LKSGQSVLIHAGASGVGQAAIQVARMGGASKIFTTAGTDEKCKLCKSLGADFAINYNSADFAEVISREMGGKGVNMIIDLVGQNYWHRNTEAAAMEGKIVLVAAMSGSMIEGFNLRALLNKRLWVMATTLRTRDAEYQGMLRDKFVDVAMENLKNGRMGVTVDKIFSWKDVAEAHKRMEANVNAGKLICVIDS